MQSCLFCDHNHDVSTLPLQASQKAVADREAEKQGIAEKIAATESRVVAAEKAKSKYQEEVDRMRKALEQSMTRIHRMSSDSDQYVDR
jgi:ubiquinone biosynthesis protein UbiJ